VMAVYVAGKFRGPDHWTIEQNIRRAEEVALEIWRLGCVPYTPHLETRFFQGVLPDVVYLRGDLEMLRRCDAVVTVPGWEASKGARAEVEQAQTLNIPVWTLDEFRLWVNRFTSGGL
jgi:hypothetical protein